MQEAANLNIKKGINGDTLKTGLTGLRAEIPKIAEELCVEHRETPWGDTAEDEGTPTCLPKHTYTQKNYNELLPHWRRERQGHRCKRSPTWA